MSWGSRASRALEPWRVRLAAEARDRQLVQNPEAARFYTAESLRVVAHDAETHLHVLTDALALGRPALFVRQMAWVRASIEPHGLPADDLCDFLRVVRDLVQERAPEAAEEAGAAIDAAVRVLEVTASSAPSHVGGHSAAATAAREFLQHLVQLEHEAAERLLQEAIDAGLTIRQAYEEVLFPALREIGRLWQLDRISVATEHYATAAIREVAARLHPRLVAPRVGRSAVIACVESDLHDMGARLIADLLESEGWEIVFLGARTPPAALLGLLHLRKPDALLLCATRVLDLKSAEAQISALRQQAAVRHVPIVIGGAPFTDDPTLHEVLGADARAVGPKDAHRAASELTRYPGA